MNRRTFLAVLGGSFLFPGVPEREAADFFDTKENFGEWCSDEDDDWIYHPIPDDIPDYWVRERLAQEHTKRMFQGFERAIWFGSHDL
jgi:hypothetical protein